jgi:hypothetical protein
MPRQLNQGETFDQYYQACVRGAKFRRNRTMGSEPGTHAGG